MRRQRLASRTSVTDQEACLASQSNDEVASRLIEGVKWQTRNLLNDGLYWQSYNDCLAYLSRRLSDKDGQLKDDARVYNHFGSRLCNLRTDLLQTARRFAGDVADKASEDAECELTGSIVFLFITSNLSTGSRTSHSVTVNTQTVELTHEVKILPPLPASVARQAKTSTCGLGRTEKVADRRQAKRQVKEASSAEATEKPERENSEQQPEEAGGKASNDASKPSGKPIELQDREQQRNSDEDQLDQPQHLASLSSHGGAKSPSPPCRSFKGSKVCLEGIGMSSCPSNEPLDDVTDSFVIGIACSIEGDSMTQRLAPIVSLVAPVLAAYRIGQSAAGQPDLASTKTATTSTEASGESVGDNSQSRSEPPPRSRTVSARDGAPKAVSRDQKRPKVAAQKAPSAAPISRKRLVLVTLEYQKDGKSAAWQNPTTMKSPAGSVSVDRRSSKATEKPKEKSCERGAKTKAAPSSARKPAQTAKQSESGGLKVKQPQHLTAPTKALLAASNSSVSRVKRKKSSAPGENKK